MGSITKPIPVVLWLITSLLVIEMFAFESRSLRKRTPLLEWDGHSEAELSEDNSESFGWPYYLSWVLLLSYIRRSRCSWLGFVFLWNRPDKPTFFGIWRAGLILSSLSKTMRATSIVKFLLSFYCDLTLFNSGMVDTDVSSAFFRGTDRDSSVLISLTFYRLAFLLFKPLGLLYCSISSLSLFVTINRSVRGTSRDCFST